MSRARTSAISTYDDDFQIQKGDTTAVTPAAAVHLERAGGGGPERARTGELPYTLRGQLTVQTPFGEHQIPFTREGRAPCHAWPGRSIPARRPVTTSEDPTSGH